VRLQQPDTYAPPAPSHHNSRFDNQPINATEGEKPSAARACVPAADIVSQFPPNRQRPPRRGPVIGGMGGLLRLCLLQFDGRIGHRALP